MSDKEREATDEERQAEVGWLRVVDANRSFADSLPDDFTFRNLLQKTPSKFALYISNPEKIRTKEAVVAVVCELKAEEIRQALEERFLLEELLDYGAVFKKEDGHFALDPDRYQRLMEDEQGRNLLRGYVRSKSETTFVNLWSAIPSGLQLAMNRMVGIANAEVETIIEPSLSLTRMANDLFKREQSEAKKRIYTRKQKRGPQPAWTKSDLRKATRAAVRAFKQESENKYKTPTLGAVVGYINAITDDSSKHFTTGKALGKQLERRGLSWEKLSSPNRRQVLERKT